MPVQKVKVPRVTEKPIVGDFNRPDVASLADAMMGDGPEVRDIPVSPSDYIMSSDRGSVLDRPTGPEASGFPFEDEDSEDDPDDEARELIDALNAVTPSTVADPSEAVDVGEVAWIPFDEDAPMCDYPTTMSDERLAELAADFEKASAKDRQYSFVNTSGELISIHAGELVLTLPVGHTAVIIPSDVHHVTMPRSEYDRMLAEAKQSGIESATMSASDKLKLYRDIHRSKVKIATWINRTAIHAANGLELAIIFRTDLAFGARYGRKDKPSDGTEEECIAWVESAVRADNWSIVK